MSLVAAAITVTAGSQLYSGYQQKKAAKQQGYISEQNAEHQREVARYNAGIFQDQAARLRDEQVGRIREVAGINIGRLQESSRISMDRARESTFTNVGRLNEEASINIGRLRESAEINIGRINEQVEQTAVRGAEDENALRRGTAEQISSQRAFYGAGNVVIDSGTPANMQIDTARMGEVDALRIRRNYRIEQDALIDKAEDIARIATQQMEDTRRLTNYQVSDMTRDLYQFSEDTRRNTGYQVSDISRNLGYDLSDVNFEANQLDQQAALTLMQGDAAYTAGMNRAGAYRDAGRDAFTASILGAGSSALTGAINAGVSPKWFSKDSVAVDYRPISQWG